MELSRQSPRGTHFERTVATHPSHLPNALGVYRARLGIRPYSSRSIARGFFARFFPARFFSRAFPALFFAISARDFSARFSGAFSCAFPRVFRALFSRAWFALFFERFFRALFNACFCFHFIYPFPLFIYFLNTGPETWTSTRTPVGAFRLSESRNGFADG